jgi:hypothetical protein
MGHPFFYGDYPRPFTPRSTIHTDEAQVRKPLSR